MEKILVMHRRKKIQYIMENPMYLLNGKIDYFVIWIRSLELTHLGNIRICQSYPCLAIMHYVNKRMCGTYAQLWIQLWFCTQRLDVFVLNSPTISTSSFICILIEQTRGLEMGAAQWEIIFLFFIGVSPSNIRGTARKDLLGGSQTCRIFFSLRFT